MKTRFFPLIAVGATAVTVVGTAYLAGSAAFDIHSQAVQQRASQHQDQEIPDVNEALMSDMERLYPLIGGLSRPDREALTGDVRFQLLGFDEEAVATHEEEELPDEERFDRHVVAMTYVSPASSFAVIDGGLYRVGDTIEGSTGRVRTITPDRVLIAGRRARQWIDVDNRDAADNGAVPAPDLAGGRTPESAREERDREEEAQRRGIDDVDRQELLQSIEALRAIQPRD